MVVWRQRTNVSFPSLSFTISALEYVTVSYTLGVSQGCCRTCSGKNRSSGLYAIIPFSKCTAWAKSSSCVKGERKKGVEKLISVTKLNNVPESATSSISSQVLRGRDWTCFKDHRDDHLTHYTTWSLTGRSSLGHHPFMRIHPSTSLSHTSFLNFRSVRVAAANGLAPVSIMKSIDPAANTSTFTPSYACLSKSRRSGVGGSGQRNLVISHRLEKSSRGNPPATPQLPTFPPNCYWMV